MKVDRGGRRFKDVEVPKQTVFVFPFSVIISDPCAMPGEQPDRAAAGKPGLKSLASVFRTWVYKLVGSSGRMLKSKKDHFIVHYAPIT